VHVAPGTIVTSLLYEAAQDGVPATFVLAHGAGAGQTSPFIVDFASAMARLGIETVTFNFPYLERRRRIPDRAPVLEACYRSMLEAVLDRNGSRHQLFIGGKSMGGRIATQVAAADRDTPIRGLVLLGYPLHPPGRPSQRREQHLPAVGRPMLFVQGSRDAFGTPEEIKPVLRHLVPPATLHVVAGGDHSFKVARRGEQAAVHDDVQRTVAEWMQDIVKGASVGPDRAP
jgi:predicted alpha/beta-hydrolase family hydrolase